NLPSRTTLTVLKDWSTISVLAMSKDINPHIGAEELEDYAMGRIPEEQSGRLEEHLLICATCRQRLEECDSYTSAMRQAAQLVDSPAPPLSTTARQSSSPARLSSSPARLSSLPARLEGRP